MTRPAARVLSRRTVPPPGHETRARIAARLAGRFVVVALLVGGPVAAVIWAKLKLVTAIPRTAYAEPDARDASPHAPPAPPAAPSPQRAADPVAQRSR